MSFHAPSLIEKKRDGGALAADEIGWLVDGLVDGSIADYQWSALAMAIYFRGMTAGETWNLTKAMRDSGEMLEHPAQRPLVVDKHSTGGIGDKTSLILAPLLACTGAWVPMISGRGLGKTGGTLDKLESIPGFRVQLESAEVERMLQVVGCVMAGQSGRLCPADRKLYSLRDVTGTVPSQPLIVASIMSKKLAETLDRLVLDVKFGSGAFMKSKEEAQQLADAMEAVGQLAGVRVRAKLNPMNAPLGRTAGNALEIREAVDILRGGGPDDVLELCLDLAVEVVDCSRGELLALIQSGAAWQKFQQMAAGQGAEVASIEKVGRSLHVAPVIRDMRAKASGCLTWFDAEKTGRACVLLGAGRARAQDPVDFAVGVDEIVRCGSQVRAGDPLCRIHARTAALAEEAEQVIQSGVVVS